MAEITIMNNVSIAPTACTPGVDFDFKSNVLRLNGESYPENAAAFYRPLIAVVEELTDSLRSAASASVAMHVALSYFNSSSTKMLFSLFDVLNSGAEAGIAVDLHWYYDQEDDISEEFGQELSIDFPAMSFHMHPES